MSQKFAAYVLICDDYVARGRVYTAPQFNARVNFINKYLTVSKERLIGDEIIPYSLHARRMILVIGISIGIALSLDACAAQSPIPQRLVSFSPCNAPCSYKPKLTDRASLGEVIDSYGPPDKISADFVPGSEQFQILDVTLFYPSLGMTILVMKTSNQNISELTRDFAVLEVAFWKSRTLNDMANESKMIYAPEAYILANGLQDWPGFGPIKGR